LKTSTFYVNSLRTLRLCGYAFAREGFHVKGSFFLPYRF